MSVSLWPPSRALITWNSSSCTVWPIAIFSTASMLLSPDLTT